MDIITHIEFVIKYCACAGDDTATASCDDRRNGDCPGVSTLLILVSPSTHFVFPPAIVIYDADTAAPLGAVAFFSASRAFVSTSRIFAAINSVA